MIRGRFDGDGRPTIDCILSFTPIKRLGDRALPIPISFVIDTGSDTTLILPEHYEPYQYGDFIEYPLDHPEGYGGAITVRRVPAGLYFRHDTGNFVRVSMEVEIARPRAGLSGLPSVLGRDLLDFYKLTIHKPSGTVALDVDVSAEQLQ